MRPQEWVTASLLASAMALGGLPAAAAPGDALVVVGDAVNVRAAPEIGAGIRMRLDRQHLVVELQREGNWVRVEVAGSGGREGWIHGSLLAMPTGERLAGPPGTDQRQLPAAAPSPGTPDPGREVQPPSSATAQIAVPAAGAEVPTEPRATRTARAEAAPIPAARPESPAAASAPVDQPPDTTSAPLPETTAKAAPSPRPAVVPPDLRDRPTPVAVAIEPQGVAIERVAEPGATGGPVVTASLPPIEAARTGHRAPSEPSADAAPAPGATRPATDPPEPPAGAEPTVAALPQSATAGPSDPATIEPGAAPSPDEGLARFRESVTYLNGRAVSVAGVDLFTGADPIGNGIVQVHATDAWRTIPPAGRESYLNALLDRWSAASGASGPVSVQIVDPVGTVMMERQKP